MGEMLKDKCQTSKARESGFNAPSVSARPRTSIPFLLLDDFRNDNPAIDVRITLSLKPN